MFLMRSDTESAETLASLPMEKFFNLNENPFTTNLDLSEVVAAEEKADGSLISTYVSGTELLLKTKGSTKSPQCVAALEWLRLHPRFMEQTRRVARSGYTVNMEWCAPDNRIVVAYDEPSLRVLKVRSHFDGEYLPLDDLSVFKFETDEIQLRRVPTLTVADWDVWANEVVPAEEGIEGYVLRFQNGMRVKMKTAWYMVRHNSRDILNNPKRLFEAVLEGMTDDLRSRFHDDPLTIRQIAEMEELVEKEYNQLVDHVESFYRCHKSMERKSYVDKARRELPRLHFRLAMKLYDGNEVDFKAVMKARWKIFAEENKVQGT